MWAENEFRCECCARWLRDDEQRSAWTSHPFTCPMCQSAIDEDEPYGAFVVGVAEMRSSYAGRFYSLLVAPRAYAEEPFAFDMGSLATIEFASPFEIRLGDRVAGSEGGLVDVFPQGREDGPFEGHHARKLGEDEGPALDAVIASMHLAAIQKGGAA